MSINIFLSRPTPYNDMQKLFLAKVTHHLKCRGLAPRTIGDTDYGREPMPHIRAVMTDCNGLLGLALRRFKVIKGVDRPDAVADQFLHVRADANLTWLTTPYIHLESAIAFHIGLPILLLVEKDVVKEGALEAGIMGVHPPEVDLASERCMDDFLASQQWQQLVNTWEGEVREVVYSKGRPPRLYQR